MKLEKREAKASIAFIGWNPFQLIHALPIAMKTPGSVFVIEKRKNYLEQFDDGLLEGAGIPVVVWPKKKLYQIDGIFDVIVCQTPFSQIEMFTKSKIVMLQYGYAKEVHNYGPWRAFGDISLVYGKYAAQKIAPMSAVEEVGVPGLDVWHCPTEVKKWQQKYAHLLDLNRPTVLYVPTWGALSTYDLFVSSVLALCGKYNVVLKLHHSTDMLDSSRKQQAVHPNVHLFGANDRLVELLAISDVVLSDYSGAIFDALYCDKPIILLHGDIHEKIGDKIDNSSLEYARRHDIGPVISKSSELSKIVADVLAGTIDYRDKNASLCKELFVRDGHGVARCVAAILRIAKGETIANSPPFVLRHEYGQRYLDQQHRRKRFWRFRKRAQYARLS